MDRCFILGICPPCDVSQILKCYGENELINTRQIYEKIMFDFYIHVRSVMSTFLRCLHKTFFKMSRLKDYLLRIFNSIFDKGNPHILLNHSIIFTHNT